MARGNFAEVPARATRRRAERWRISGKNLRRSAENHPTWDFPFIFPGIHAILRGLKVELKWRRRIIRAVCALVLMGCSGWFALPFAIPLPDGCGKLRPPRRCCWIVTAPRSCTSRCRIHPARGRCGRRKFPPDIIACTLAAEDKRFYTHGGVDPLATLRAGRDFFAKRRIVSGASTITQQLIKITSPPAHRSPFTKIREALAARRLEMTWSKRRILTAYLNHLDYGNLRIGTAEAARFYFQKPLADLSLAECALLAGLPQSPSRLNPIRHPAARARPPEHRPQPPRRRRKSRPSPHFRRPCRAAHPAPAPRIQARPVARTIANFKS